MPMIPAVCPNGHQYPSGFFVGEGATNIQFVGNRSQCPVCGLMGVVEDGTFSVRGGVLTRSAVAAVARSVAHLTDDEITELRRLLEDAPTEETAAALTDVAGPFRRIAEIIGAPASGGLAMWATLVAMIVFWVIDHRTGGGPIEISPDQVDQIIEAIKRGS